MKQEKIAQDALRSQREQNGGSRRHVKRIAAVYRIASEEERNEGAGCGAGFTRAGWGSLHEFFREYCQLRLISNLDRHSLMANEAAATNSRDATPTRNEPSMTHCREAILSQYDAVGRDKAEQVFQRKKTGVAAWFQLPAVSPGCASSGPVLGSWLHPLVLGPGAGWKGNTFVPSGGRCPFRSDGRIANNPLSQILIHYSHSFPGHTCMFMMSW